ncbi:MAG TPA: CHC2 zinc finger domain-containing protein [Bacteroidales bacterium]|nr:CHC2 zinc finger domain-containing protein [Bacteroidales bacterium]
MLIQYELVSIFNDLLGQQARLRKGGEQATYHCPFCPDKNPTTKKLEIAISGPKVGYFHCWRCNTKGRTFGSLLKKLNASSHYREAIFKLTGDLRLLRKKTIIKDDSQVQLPPEFHPLYLPRKSPEYKNALAYLIRRRLTASDIYRYNIGYCEDGEYERYIIIPSYDAKGKLNFFIGRKYYNNSLIT